MDFTQIIITLLTSVSSVVVALITAGYIRRKDDKSKEAKSKKLLVDQIQKDAVLLVIQKFKRTNKMHQNSVIVTGLTEFEILKLDWVIQILFS